MSELQRLKDELKEVEEHIRELDMDGYRISEDLLAKLERLKVEIALEHDK